MRLEHGVAAINEQLRAQTAYAQASYNRIKAQGDAETKLGTLALDMGSMPDQALTLSSLQITTFPSTRFVRPVHDLLAQAESLHPELEAAREQLLAAQANVDAVRAQGLPTITLQSTLSRSTQPQSLSIGEPLINTNTHQRAIGIEVQVPLFEGFSRTYKIRSAEAQVEQQSGHLAEVEQQVQLDIWSNAHALQTASANLSSTQQVLDSARAALRLARRRYLSGVTDIQEMLDVQNTLAAAEKQRIQGITDWYNARIQLAYAIGTLGMWATQ